MKRSETLDTAKEYVCKDREERYGSPEDNFGLIAKFWDMYIDEKLEIAGKQNKYKDGDIKTHNLVAEDVANMMGLLKLARIMTGKANPDNYIDFAGYIACACEIATETRARSSCVKYVGCELEGHEDVDALYKNWIERK